VAGYIVDGLKKKAGFWENGTWKLLYGDTAAEATDIVVSGSNVYVSGYYTNASGKSVACYWKNDSTGRVDLYDSATMHGRADGIAVSGSDVYAAGYSNDLDGNTKRACYWKNNAAGQVKLDVLHYSQGYAVAVSGADVYVAGYYSDSGLKAGYWQNGTWKLLHGTSNAQARDVVVAGTDVYVAGYYKNDDNNEAACYWKTVSTARVDLYSDAVNEGRAYGICLDGMDVYVAGYFDSDGSTQKACYWKNGARTVLSTSASASYAIAVAE
jgi:hypothetical protein